MKQFGVALIQSFEVFLMKALLRQLKLRLSALDDASDEVGGHSDAEVQTDSVEDPSLSSLTEDQLTGLRDDNLGGFYDNSSGELFRGFPLGPGDTLVDVGCGGGGPLVFASRFAGRIIAVDVTRETVNEARDSLRAAGSDLNRFGFIVAGAESLPIAAELATRVVCLEVLEHVDNPNDVLTEMRRVGMPDALYLISVPDERSENLMKRVAPREMYEKPHHIRTFSPESFQDIVLGAGFEIISHSFNGFFRAMSLAMLWSRYTRVNDSSHSAPPMELANDDPVLRQWTRSWAALLDTAHGPQVKHLLDEFLPKSQIIVARKR